MKNLRKDNKGFSLVELLVVIAIMVVLVGVVAPSLLANVEKAREAKDVQALDTLVGAVQACLADEAIYDAITDSASNVSFSVADAYDATKNALGATYTTANTNLATGLASYMPKANVFDASGKVVLFGGKEGKKATTLTVTINVTTGKVKIQASDASGVITGKSGTKYEVER